MTILHAARSAYAAGLCILPVAADGTKRPDMSSWSEFQSLRPTTAQMRAWAFEHRHGFGVIAGAVSGRRECWDFDERDTYAAFVREANVCGLGDVWQRLRAGYEDATPNGGRRLIVSYPADVPWRDCTLARRPGRDGEPAVKTLIELPTFAIVAPSSGPVHPSGRPYVRLTGDFPTIASYTADERDALLELARAFDQMPRREAAVRPAGRAAHSWSRPGDAFNARATWPEILEPAGWTRAYDRHGVTYWRRPGKARGISASTNVGGSDLFYPFTSSTAFEADRSYTKFGTFTVLHHGGDHAVAARALAGGGPGPPARSPARPRRAPLEPAAAPAWRWLGNVPREQVHWLWPSRLAVGTLTLWIGDGGLGKSRASQDVAARITTGALWPDGDAAPAGTVVILSAEDSPSYTLRPAIEAAGGDVSKVAILDAVHDASGHERTFNLAADLPALDTLIEATGARLVIVDPVSAYFGTSLDSYRDTDVRSVLEPLVKLAERRHVALLGIMHVGKGSDRQARHRALGSVAFVNAARLVFAVGPDPNNPTRRILAAVKANLCREAPALAFKLEDVNGMARVVWESAPVLGITADAVLDTRPTSEPDQQDAESVIRDLLAEESWPLEANHALEAGRAHGIHERTMRRVAAKLGIRITRIGFGRGGRWRWHRPEDAEKPIADTIPAIGAIHKRMSSMEEVSPMAAMESPIGDTNTIEDTQTHTGQNGPYGVRNDDPLPAWVTEAAEPDLSDPIGAHDAGGATEPVEGASRRSTGKAATSQDS